MLSAPLTGSIFISFIFLVFMLSAPLAKPMLGLDRGAFLFQNFHYSFSFPVTLISVSYTIITSGSFFCLTLSLCTMDNTFSLAQLFRQCNIWSGLHRKNHLGSNPSIFFILLRKTLYLVCTFHINPLKSVSASTVKKHAL